MKFLADMPISLKTVYFLRGKGYDIYHLREKGLQTISDDEIIERARKEERTILTADLDFGFLMSLSRERFPSIILFRLGDERSENINFLMEKYLNEIVEYLVQGAIIVFEQDKVRIRRLPIIKENT